MTTQTPAAVSGELNASVLSERLRVSSILESPEGKRNPVMAIQLALRTALDPETACALLSTAPAANPYIAAMNREGPVSIEAAAADFGGDAKGARTKEISEGMAAFNAMKGYSEPNKAEG